MLKRDPQYTRLPGRGKNLMGTSSYWLGPDHLLTVRVDASTERYLRFSYRDIQAIFIHPNLSYVSINSICTVLLLISFSGMFMEDPNVRLSMAVPTVILAAVIVYNVVMGPTCTCYLKTAVHTEKLPGLNRRRAATHSIALLKIRIDQAQAAPAHPNPEPDPVV